LIVLIPKSADAKEPKDFRPITLIHSFAKLIGKLLANRLAPQMQKLISCNQSAFIKGRSIHDNFKYILRAAVLLRQRKIPKLLLKLDILKAFDTLSWQFFLEVLQAYGFSTKWRYGISILHSNVVAFRKLDG
jgi:hypothetical protein